ncbi:MAG: hypothetical protein HQ582_04030 [Planctomycetes bacterium]|nr:hypothetical protein [Planctomycetota bacterium]
MGWLFGIDMSALGRAARWHVELLRSPAAGVFPLALVALAVYAVVLYRLRPGECSHRHLVAMYVSRIVVFLVLTIMVMQPALIMETEIASRQPIAVFVDNSLSMRIKDVSGDAAYERAVAALARQADPAKKPVELSRLDIAKMAVDLPQTGLRAALGKHFDMELYGVAETAEPTETVGRLEVTGTATRLGDALVESMRSHVERTLAGVILITDGQTNEGVALEAAADRLAAANIPAWSVGIGRPTPIVDLAVAELAGPDVVAKGSTGRLNFMIRRLPPGKAEDLKVTLERNGKVVQTKSLPVTAEAREVAGAFDISAPAESATRNPGISRGNSRSPR